MNNMYRTYNNLRLQNAHAVFTMSFENVLSTVGKSIETLRSWFLIIFLFLFLFLFLSTRKKYANSEIAATIPLSRNIINRLLNRAQLFKA